MDLQRRRRPLLCSNCWMLKSVTVAYMFFKYTPFRSLIITVSNGHKRYRYHGLSAAHNGLHLKRHLVTCNTDKLQIAFFLLLEIKKRKDAMKLKIFKMKKICEWKVEDKMAKKHYCIVIAVRIWRMRGLRCGNICTYKQTRSIINLSQTSWHANKLNRNHYFVKLQFPKIYL